MNFKIFQICFEQSQIRRVDELLTPFDNTENLQPELREYPNLIRIYEDYNEHLDAWGVFGPRWQEKIKYSSKDIFEDVAENQDCDVFLFNHARVVDALTYNVWEQGEFYHKGITQVTRQALKQAGYDPGVTEMLMNDQVTCYCSYFVAKKEFWKDYLEFLAKIKEQLENLPEEESKIYNSSANYSRDGSLNLFPFIVERLFSTYLLINNGKYKIYSKAYDYTVYSNQIKDFSDVLTTINNMKSRISTKEQYEDWNRIRMYFIRKDQQLFNLD